MKLSRRGMMGAAVGAVVAGPKGIQAAMNQARTMPFPPVPGASRYIGDEMLAKEAHSKQWTMESLAKLKRLAAGDIRDEDKNYPTEGPPQPYRALQSVSEDAKSFMRNRLYENQWRERTIKAALDALDNYDKTGILRTFF